MSDSIFYSLDGPLDSMPAARQVRTANLSGFLDLVRQLGADPRQILENHGIDPRVVRDPDSFIECRTLAEILEYCSASLDEPLFGLRLAHMQEADVYGCVAALCRAASSVGEAISGFIDYIPVVHSPVTILELAEGRETVELRWGVRADLGVNSQANYQAALLNLKLLRLIGGPGFRPSYVNLAVTPRHKDVPEIESRLGCVFHGHATANAIAFPRALLNTPVASSNRLLYRLVGSYLDRVKASSRTTIVERVEDYIRGSLSSGNCSIVHCAKKFGTSVRTLQGNLGERGLKFSDILERQRIDLAQGYLQRPQLSLDDVAALLGYSEQSSFGRAFKRWTGLTPQCYRQRLGTGDGDEAHRPQSPRRLM
jgi:AraC-like DNA-binding protein